MPNNEQTIKRRLNLIDFEEGSVDNASLSQIPNIKRMQEAITDWSDANFDLLHFKKSYRLGLKELSTPRYRSTVIRQDRSQRKMVELNPVVVKFNARYLSYNLNKSKQLFIKKIKQHSFPSGQSLNTLYQRKLLPQKRLRPLQLISEEEQYNSPFSNRFSMIFRSLKKQEPVRRKRNYKNPEQMISVRLC